MKQTQSLVSHSDAVTCLDTIDHNYVLSGGHDGSIRIWDLRKFHCVFETPAHRKKYDEGVMALTHHSDIPMLLSAGADGIVKLFQSQLML